MRRIRTGNRFKTICVGWQVKCDTYDSCTQAKKKQHPVLLTRQSSASDGGAICDTDDVPFASQVKQSPTQIINFFMKKNILKNRSETSIYQSERVEINKSNSCNLSQVLQLSTHQDLYSQPIIYSISDTCENIIKILRLIPKTTKKV